MSDYCHNILQIVGDSKEVTRFKDQAGDEYEDCIDDRKVTFKIVLSLQKFIPAPDHLDLDGCLDWCTENWGSRGDISAERLIDNAYTFRSVSAAPVLAILAISKQFPTLLFILTYQKSYLDDRNPVEFGHLVIRNGAIDADCHIREAISAVGTQQGQVMIGGVLSNNTSGGPNV